MFQKGQSGNPGGRARTTVFAKDFYRARRSQNHSRLVELSDQEENLVVALKATIYLNDNDDGKPVGFEKMKTMSDADFLAYVEKAIIDNAGSNKPLTDAMKRILRRSTHSVEVRSKLIEEAPAES